MSAPRFAWAGLVLGPAAWAASTQLGVSFVPYGCEHDGPTGTGFTLACLAIALAATLWSWHAWRRLRPEQSTHRFIAVIGAQIGTLFALVIAVQGLAGLFLSGCEQ